MDRRLADVILCCHRVDGSAARFAEDLRYLTFRVVNGFRHIRQPRPLHLMKDLLIVSLSTDAILHGVTLSLRSKQELLQLRFIDTAICAEPSSDVHFLLAENCASLPKFPNAVTRHPGPFQHIWRRSSRHSGRRGGCGWRGRGTRRARLVGQWPRVDRVSTDHHADENYRASSRVYQVASRRWALNELGSLTVHVTVRVRIEPAREFPRRCGMRQNILLPRRTRWPRT
jgi:hypothetical protein